MEMEDGAKNEWMRMAARHLGLIPLVCCFGPEQWAEDEEKECRLMDLDLTLPEILERTQAMNRMK